jgi:hypothetical protein
VKPASVNTQVTKVIKLAPEDWYLASWRKLPPLPRPEPAPFDREACLTRIADLPSGRRGWAVRWDTLHLPASLTIEEASFWYITMTRACTAREELVEVMRKADWSGHPDLATASMSIEQPSQRLPGQVVIPLANLLPIEDLFGLIIEAPKVPPTIDFTLAQQMRWQDDIVESFVRCVLPYLTPGKLERLQGMLRPRLVPPSPGVWNDQSRPLPIGYRLAGYLGLHDEAKAIAATIPTDFIFHFGPAEDVLCGLGDPHQVAFEVRRRFSCLYRLRSLRAWLAQTEFSALDVVRNSIRPSRRNRRMLAARMTIFTKVKAPEAALHMLELRRAGIAPTAARHWLEEQVGNGVAGLLPVAAGRGKPGETAREYLRTVKRRGFGGVIEQQLSHAELKVARRIRRTVLDELAVPSLSAGNMPAELRDALAAIPSRLANVPDWVRPANLPSIIVAGHALDDKATSTILRALKKYNLKESIRLVSVLRRHADLSSLDDFAWKMLECWLVEGTPVRDGWVIRAVGLLGGEGCAVKMLPVLKRCSRKSSSKSKAPQLLDCLLGIDSDVALMQVGVARSFRNYQIRELAQSRFKQKAGSRSLSVEQLEDHIVPSLGLDEHAERELDYGHRQFRLALGHDLRPHVRDSQGNTRAALPNAGAKDDPLKAAAARRTWTSVRKQLDQTLKAQAARLEEAMVQGRRWTFDDFNRLILRHPVMGRFARRLLWGCFDPADTLLAGIRLTEEGELVNLREETVVLVPWEMIGLVHPIHMSEERRLAWGELFADYEIVQPFLQLGRPIYAPPPDEKTKLARLVGRQMETRHFCPLLGTLGWETARGSPSGYHKQFTRFGVTALVEAGGYRVLQLGEAYFARTEDERTARGKPIPLSDVDPVLVSELIAMVKMLEARSTIPPPPPPRPTASLPFLGSHPDDLIPF